MKGRKDRESLGGSSGLDQTQCLSEWIIDGVGDELVQDGLGAQQTAGGDGFVEGNADEPRNGGDDPAQDSLPAMLPMYLPYFASLVNDEPHHDYTPKGFPKRLSLIPLPQ